jgi:chromosome segregation ATPase
LTLKNCTKYDEYLDRSLARLEVFLNEMEKIDRRISAMSSRIADSERLIARLQDEYYRIKCNTLVPGQTTQSTINRCAAILSEWNKLQTEINTMRTELTGLSASYAAMQKQVNVQQKMIAKYTEYLAIHCKKSIKLQAARKMEARHVKFRNTAGSISDAINRLTKLRAIRIDATTK